MKMRELPHYENFDVEADYMTQTNNSVCLNRPGYIS